MRRGIGRLRAGSGSTFLFDATNAPASAYGSRQLTSSYTGPLFRVVRASDSTTLDVQQSGGLPDVAALTTFLSGTSGKVDIVYDQVGSNNATQTVDASRPKINLEVFINGGLAITFSTGYLNLPAGAINATTQAAHGFGVFEPVSAFPLESAYFQMGSTATAANQGTLSQGATAALGWIRANPGSVTTTVAPDCRPSVYEYHMGTTAQGGLFFYQNDETLSAVETPAVAFTGGMIGNTMVTAAYEGKFFFGCALFYNSRQTPAFATAMKARMAAMFGITIAPTTKRLIIDGDSIGGAYTASLNWYGIVQRMRRSLPACRIHNISQNGFQLQNTVTDYASKVAPLLSRYGGSNCVYVEQRSYNDFDLGARTSAQAIADIQTIANSVLATGAKFVATVTTPNALGGSGGTNMATYNAWLKANWVSQGWHGLIDVTVDPTYGTYNVAYEPDGIHPNATACAAFAPYWVSVLSPLL